MPFKSVRVKSGANDPSGNCACELLNENKATIKSSRFFHNNYFRK